MKRILAAAFILFLSFRASAQIDSLRAAGLNAKLDEYVPAIQAASLPEQYSEVDFVIGSCEDKVTREFVARSLYDRFRNSRIMGSENVAVHIYDRWFADGTLRPGSDTDMLAARIFAEFNRQSLIGARAPELVLNDASGAEKRVVPGSDGRDAVLYFYDIDCSKCRIETIMLRNILENGDYPVDVYLVCVSSDRAKWLSYVADNFTMNLRRTRVWNLFDDSRSYAYQMKYGVLQTPRLFLTDGDGVIVGRQLSATALDRLLSEKYIAPELEYGSDESVALYDGIFSAFDTVTVDDFRVVADHLEKKTLGELHDTTMFRQMTGDLLYYLTGRSGEGYKMAQAGFIDSKILGRPDIWKSADDSLKVVSLAVMMKGVVAKTPIGEPVPDVVLNGVLHDRWDALRRGKVRSYALRRMRGTENIVLFYVDGCENCAAEKAAVPDYVKTRGRKSKFLFVDMAAAVDSDPGLLDVFDLSSSPMLISFDKGGTVTRKYFTIANR